jgi:hypothetical protein
MQTSAAWMSDTPPLACLSGLAHREALQRLRDDPAARAEMTASAQWSAAHRWADQWATTDQAYYVALRRGFAAQCDIQRGVMTLAGAERWALPDRQPARLSYFESRAATPLRGADIGPPTFAGDWIRGWLADLERHILPAPPTTAAYSALMTAGVDLLTWLANHLSQIPEGVGAEDQSLRAIRRAWSEFAPPGVSRVQTDSIRRLYLGTVANGHRTGGSSKHAPYPSSRCPGPCPSIKPTPRSPCSPVTRSSGDRSWSEHRPGGDSGQRRHRRTWSSGARTLPGQSRRARGCQAHDGQRAARFRWRSLIGVPFTLQAAVDRPLVTPIQHARWAPAEAASALWLQQLRPVGAAGLIDGRVGWSGAQSIGWQWTTEIEHLEAQARIQPGSVGVRVSKHDGHAVVDTGRDPVRGRVAGEQGDAVNPLILDLGRSPKRGEGEHDPAVDREVKGLARLTLLLGFEPLVLISSFRYVRVSPVGSYLTWPLYSTLQRALGCWCV